MSGDVEHVRYLNFARLVFLPFGVLSVVMLARDGFDVHMNAYFERLLDLYDDTLSTIVRESFARCCAGGHGIRATGGGSLRCCQMPRAATAGSKGHGNGCACRPSGQALPTTTGLASGDFVGRRRRRSASQAKRGYPPPGMRSSGVGVAACITKPHDARGRRDCASVCSSW